MKEARVQPANEEEKAEDCSGKTVAVGNDHYVEVHCEGMQMGVGRWCSTPWRPNRSTRRDEKSKSEGSLLYK